MSDDVAAHPPGEKTPAAVYGGGSERCSDCGGLYTAYPKNCCLDCHHARQTNTEGKDWMGIYPINCPQCGRLFNWFSGTVHDQRCPDCRVETTSSDTAPKYTLHCCKCGPQSTCTVCIRKELEESNLAADPNYCPQPGEKTHKSPGPICEAYRHKDWFSDDWAEVNCETCRQSIQERKEGEGDGYSSPGNNPEARPSLSNQGPSSSTKSAEAVTLVPLSALETKLIAFGGRTPLEYIADNQDDGIDYVLATLQRIYGGTAQSRNDSAPKYTLHCCKCGPQSTCTVCIRAETEESTTDFSIGLLDTMRAALDVLDKGDGTTAECSAAALIRDTLDAVVTCAVCCQMFPAKRDFYLHSCAAPTRADSAVAEMQAESERLKLYPWQARSAEKPGSSQANNFWDSLTPRGQMEEYTRLLKENFGLKGAVRDLKDEVEALQSRSVSSVEDK